MKRIISKLLFNLARKLNPAIVLEHEPKSRQLGITLHITKKDVRDWRKSHPECKSHRQGLKSLIEEARWRVAGAIGRGLLEKNIIQFDVSSSLYVADVSGSIFVYEEE